MPWLLVVAALLLASAGGAIAQEQEKGPEHAIDTSYEACNDKNPSTQGMLACANAAEEAWDKELNAAYGALVRSLEGKALETLKQAQRAWLAQREKEYELHATIHAQLDGSMWGPVMADQRVTLLKQRALQLRAYKSFLEEGGR